MKIRVQLTDKKKKKKKIILPVVKFLRSKKFKTSC